MRYSLRGLEKIEGAELLSALAGIPAGVTHLDLSNNRLGYMKVELTTVFAAIPVGVTHLDLGNNSLNFITGAKLANALAIIPGGVTHLGLVNVNDGIIAYLTCEKIRTILAAIPAGVTHLDWRANFLDKYTGEDLRTILASIPVGLTHLDLSYNRLGYLTGKELATAFSGIPVGLTHLDLSRNLFGDDLFGQKITAEELATALAGIPASVKTINIGMNGLFIYKTTEERNHLLRIIQPYNLNGRLQLDNNGESESQRALLPLASLVYSENLNKDVTALILEYLSPTGTRNNRAFYALSEKIELLHNRKANFAKLNHLLDGLAIKTQELNTRGCIKAYEAANTLHTTLTRLKDQYYLNDTIDYPTFNARSLEAIKRARPELKQHRGWKMVSESIARRLAGLGLFSFNDPFKTDSIKKLDELTDIIEPPTHTAGSVI